MDRLTDEVRQESMWTIMFVDNIVISSEGRELVEEVWTQTQRSKAEMDWTWDRWDSEYILQGMLKMKVQRSRKRERPPIRFMDVVKQGMMRAGGQGQGEMETDDQMTTVVETPKGATERRGVLKCFIVQSTIYLYLYQFKYLYFS